MTNATAARGGTEEATGIPGETAGGAGPAGTGSSDARSRRRGRARRTLAGLLRSPSLLVAFVVVALALLAAFAPTLLASQDPFRGVPADKLSAPGAAHWFGTDYLGRDLYARVVHGAALSLGAAFVAVGIALVVGSVVGLVSGFFGGAVDAVIMRLVDVLLAVPGLLLSLVLVTVLGFGTLNVAIAVGVAAVAVFARLARSEVLSVRTSLYVEAAAVGGVRRRTILWRHVLPNAAGPVLALATLEFGTAILAVSALSFLGFGAAPPAPEWGTLISEGRGYLATSWWLTTMPGLVVVAVVLSINRIGRAFQPRGVR